MILALAAAVKTIRGWFYGHGWQYGKGWFYNN